MLDLTKKDYMLKYKGQTIKSNCPTIYPREIATLGGNLNA